MAVGDGGDGRVRERILAGGEAGGGAELAVCTERERGQRGRGGRGGEDAPYELTGTVTACNRLSAFSLHSQFHPIVSTLQLKIDQRGIQGAAKEEGERDSQVHRHVGSGDGTGRRGAEGGSQAADAGAGCEVLRAERGQVRTEGSAPPPLSLRDCRTSEVRL